MREVTDPEILKHFAVDEHNQVTDPSVLSQFGLANQSDINPRNKNLELFKHTTGIQQPSFAQNFAGGLLHGIQSLGQSIPDLSRMIPEPAKKALPYQEGQRPVDRIDAYKLMGTENKPFTTGEGLTQLAGELAMPGNVIKAGVAKIAPEVKSASTAIHEYFSPGKHADFILEKLGQGAKNSEEVSHSLARDIANAHDMREAEAGIYLNHALERAGEELLYKKPDPLITTALDRAENISKQMKDLKIGDLYEIFKAKPNFQNAHNLQSELGVMIRDLKSQPITGEKRLEISELKKAQSTLLKDIQNFLKQRDLTSNENLESAYKTGRDLYKQHVAPFLSSEKLRQIVRGGQTYVKNIHQAFSHPTDFINRKTGETRIGDIKKIIEDLPEESKGKILFSKIGGSKSAGNIQKLNDALIEAKNKGYSKYFTKELEDSLKEGLAKEKHQKYLKGATKYGLGGTGLVALEEILRHSLMNKGSNR